MKLVETINMQKRVLETENEELKTKINEILNERTSNLASAIDQAASASVSQHIRPSIPNLNFGSQGSMI